MNGKGLGKDGAIKELICFEDDTGYDCDMMTTMRTKERDFMNPEAFGEAFPGGCGHLLICFERALQH